mmetsp:Transcript_60399/g.118860  ORF Transcript_60399/g.118860 Transcript_60399/m.118860 type:complete len:520 (-) Transcript_60399:92-1651(-)|eukprot:CAMPEP_0170243062 /NCGR_PEP_ID=MMETSP0116_2-20130129/21304_1 /TAXON_ID=400756 /ORGANISM="Durinskia baltica, Strain CSIRO CS-38" /LENGTH=519 /DNA_ID=CAMNT_0010493911 /DNA_START=56 /DNA_END=1615 /DNA_ORIENTATION=+
MAVPVMQALFFDVAWQLLSAVPAVALLFVLIWAFARYALGASPAYIVRCMYLEFMLRKRYSAVLSPAAETEARGASKGKTPHASPPMLTQARCNASLRGVIVPTEAEYTARGQTLPPTKPVASTFPAKDPPAGQEMQYSSTATLSSSSSRPRFWEQRFGRTAKEAALLGPEEDDAWQHRVRCLREGAEAHRQVRQYVQRSVRPGMQLKEIVEMVEHASRDILGFDPTNPMKRGMAFPVGLSLNEVAAHDTVNPGDAPRWLQPTDIAKLDLGLHVEGHILDCAFTFSFDSMHDELMQAVRDATNEGIKRAGPDALVSEIGGYIREVMESAEVHRPDGTVLPIYSIKNLTGHNIAPYKIHCGKTLPSDRCGGNVRMLAGELWAVETFGSAGGVGYVLNGDNPSHFMRPNNARPGKLVTAALSDSAKAMLELIDGRFGTLAFCPRWMVREAASRKARDLLKVPGSADSLRWWESPLQELCNTGMVYSYPPLADAPGCHTAQYEHTILLREHGKEVLTRGTDY